METNLANHTNVWYKFFMKLTALSDKILLENTKSIAAREREITLEVLHHLREVERRSLFAKLGYSSLFEYALNELRYSAASAQRRISSMRLLKELPSLEKKIEEGTLNLSTLSQAQSFFRQEKISQKSQIKNSQDKIELLKSLENKSAREVEKVLISKSSEPIKLIPEIVRAVSQTQSEIKFLVESELLKEIEELRNLLAHSHPGASIKEILIYSVKNTLKALRPKDMVAKKAKNLLPTLKPKVTPLKISRYIPANVKREVWARDRGECTYKNQETGKKCACKYGLEYDHIQPYALGGESTEENLRLRCKAHNQWTAIQTFGQSKMSSFVPRIKLTPIFLEDHLKIPEMLVAAGRSPV